MAQSLEKQKLKREANRKKMRQDQTAGYFDYALLFLVIFLVAFGLIMLYSTSSYIAQTKFDGDSAYYVKKQLFSCLVGFALMIFFTAVPYQKWKKLTPLIYAAVLGLNLLVLFAGSTYSGSTRWLSIGGFSFQPSETAKIGCIMVVAYLISKSPAQYKKFGTVLKTFALILPIFALIAYSNLSTAIIVAGIVFVMLFVAHPGYKSFVWIILAGVAAVAVFLVTASYRLTRIQVWLHPEDYDTGYQTLQGLYAIGSGGLFGKGLGNSLQKLVVPEPENDMIFTIICEELGLIGGICVIILFLMLCWRFMIIASQADDLYGSMIAIGVMAHIALQTVLNIAVVTNSIPNTGVVLPFISYGGTSTMILLAEIGIVLSVSRGIRVPIPGIQQAEAGRQGA